MRTFRPSSLPLRRGWRWGREDSGESPPGASAGSGDSEAETAAPHRLRLAPHEEARGGGGGEGGDADDRELRGRAALAAFPSTAPPKLR